ncbi:MAG: glucosaminidase domain-containing protein [Woeseia sp.]
MTASITDFGQFTTLKASADRQESAALREVASQFEALFVQSMLKNMRGAKLAEPMFGSEQMDMYQDMFDQQLSLEMANGRGIGLADMLVRQMGGEVGQVPMSRETFTLPATRRMDGAVAELPDWSEPQSFVKDVWSHAERAGAALGVEPRAIVAQAALETGWGAHVMQDGNGSSSYNLFGIKAGSDWQGDSVARSTVEYENGVAERRVERFRSYPNVGAAFDDYADFLLTRGRYDQAIGQGDNVAGFAGALQEAGYATDPRYAQKISRVLNSDTMQGALSELKIDSSRPITTAGTMASVD